MFVKILRKRDKTRECLKTEKNSKKLENDYFQRLDWKNASLRVSAIGTVVTVAVVAVEGVASAKTCCEGRRLR